MLPQLQCLKGCASAGMQQILVGAFHTRHGRVASMACVAGYVHCLSLFMNSTGNWRCSRQTRMLWGRQSAPAIAARRMRMRLSLAGGWYVSACICCAALQHDSTQRIG